MLVNDAANSAGGAIPQRTVSTGRAEFVLVVRNRTPRVREREKPLMIEALVPHAAVEALHARVLIRLAWLNVLNDHPMLGGSDRERATDELRPVIVDDSVRSASRRDALREHRGDGTAGERRVHRHRQRLACAVIDHV